MNPPIAFAHRGARAHAPENTLPAFSLALRLGATGLESDVWMTADGVAVLDHDGVVRTGLRKKPISEITAQTLPQHIPTFDEFISSLDKTTHVSLDLKNLQAFEPVCRSAGNAGFPLDHLWLCHPDWQELANRRALEPDVRLVDSTRLAKISEGTERRAASLREAGIDCLNMHYSDWSGGLTTLVHRFERLAFGWDMQFDQVLDNGFRMGLDGVYSDHVDRMMDSFVREIEPFSERF